MGIRLIFKAKRDKALARAIVQLNPGSPADIPSPKAPLHLPPANPVHGFFGLQGVFGVSGFGICLKFQN